jgi:hypothetical protein
MNLLVPLTPSVYSIPDTSASCAHLARLLAAFRVPPASRRHASMVAMNYLQGSGRHDQFYIHLLSSTVAVLASGPADSRFPACHPSGWDKSEINVQFSPAVCPSG